MSAGAFFLAALSLLVIILQIRAYYLLKRQNRIILKQSIEIRQQNEVLARQNRQLNDLNAEKQQIISVVSHDLKGPFNRIFALMQLMNMSVDNLNKEQKEYLGKVHQIAIDGLNMVRNLLDTRNIEDEVIEMTLEEIDLDLFMASFVRSFKAMADRKGIELILVCPSDIYAMADRLYLNRILDNLLSNAIKFSHPKKRVTIVLEEKEKEILLIVKDEGPGISEEDQRKLYGKFQKLTAKPTGGESSTGLGLSIVKTLTEKMGGVISCESQLDVGSKFTVSLKKGTQSNK